MNLILRAPVIFDLRRRERGFTIARLASETGLSRSYCAMVNCGMIPSASARARIAAVLDLPIDSLWPGVDPPEADPLPPEAA